MGWRRNIRWAGIIAAAGIVTAGLAVLAAVTIYLNRPAGNEWSEIDVSIPPGSNLKDICLLLHAKGIVGSPRAFCALARVAPWLERMSPRVPAVDPARILAGTYRLSGAWPPLDVLARLKLPSPPKGVLLTIPEGATIWDIATLLESHRIVGSREFRDRALDQAYASSVVGWPIPSLEGYLFPDSYMFDPGMSVDAVIATFVNRFREKWKKHYATPATGTGLTPQQVITLASIIEKEAGRGEKRLVSRVFHNRLKRRWPLESCATVIYGLLPAFKGRLRSNDLANPHRYNTYVHAGFPPGPIASPGDEALAAVFAPENGCFLFFVSRNDGTNVFSCTLTEHQRLVNQYQRAHANDRRVK